MARSTIDTRPRGGVADRAVLAVAAVVLIATAAWFAISWIDTGGDSTCGSVVRPGVWLDDSAPSTCRRVMPLRAAIGAGAIAAGAFILTASITASPASVRRRRVIAVAAVTASAALLVVNELVRSDGALST